MTERRSNVVQHPRAAASPAITPFQPFYAAEIEGKSPPPLEWIVDGVLLRGTVILLAGPPKVGKSLLLQQLLTAVALGQPWLGRETVSARTFGLFCEDPQAILHRRQIAINSFYDRDAADLETNFSWLCRDHDDALLVEFEKFSDKPKFTPLWHQFVNYVKEDEREVIGLDTVATIFGGQENSRPQATAFLRELQKLAFEINGAIILSAHPSRGNPHSYSGSSAWLASVRSGLSLGRPVNYDPETGEPRDIRILRGLGSNYGAAITAEQLEYQDGVWVNTEAPTSRKRGPLSAVELSDLKYRLLIGLKRVLQNDGRVPADEMDPKSLPNRARRSTDPQINRVPLNDLYLCQQQLLDNGQIVRVEVGHRCLIRPHDGPFYRDESPWLAPPPPRQEREAAD